MTKGMFPAKSEIGRHFWAACADKRFVLPRCSGCGRLRWYLLPTCPRCHTFSYDWAELSSHAALFSYTVVHRSFDPKFNDQIPYIAAFVTPSEDPDIRFVTRLVDCDPGELKLGMPMRVAFTKVDGVYHPFFRPA